MIKLLKKAAEIDGVYYCPHAPGENCNCRKPRPGMLLKAAEELDLDLARSVMFGDKPGDATAGKLAGCAERIILGTDGRIEPSEAPDATRRFRSLPEAVKSDWFTDFCRN